MSGDQSDRLSLAVGNACALDYPDNAFDMELSLFSRDTIALSTAIALSHAMFEGALLLGICDKIVPGLLIGSLRFGHLPTIFVPGGPMRSGLPNKEKARIRQLAAEGIATREDLLEAESTSYHSPGTCTLDRKSVV